MKLPKIKNKKLIRQIVTSVLLIGVGYGIHSALTPRQNQSWVRGEVIVSVQELERQDLSDKQKFIASVEAINSVDIIPQVSGYLEEVRFQDGAFVNEGDVLFVIEQSKFISNVAMAEANLEKAKSDLTQISSDYKRQLQLYKEKITPKAELEVAENKLNQAKASIKQAEANLTLAQINLGYTEIKAPISGYIGKSLITKGNYVSPSVPKLARIVQTDPIRIAFSVSDRERIEFLTNITNENSDMRYEVVYPNGETAEIQADTIFTDNEINPETATLPVYIDHKNHDGKLIPGNYVDILVSVGKNEKTLVVPLVALAQDINGPYAMTVNKDGIVEQKYLKLGKVSGAYQEVISGLTDNDVVVVQGLQKIQPNMPVKTVLVNQ